MHFTARVDSSTDNLQEVNRKTCSEIWKAAQDHWRWRETAKALHVCV